jgi:hypothetical protein
VYWVVYGVCGLPALGFCTGEISPKKRIKILKIENEVILEAFNPRK